MLACTERKKENAFYHNHEMKSGLYEVYFFYQQQNKIYSNIFINPTSSLYNSTDKAANAILISF